VGWKYRPFSLRCSKSRAARIDLTRDLFSTGFDRQSLSALGSTAGKNFPAILSCHARTKPVGLFAAFATWLICTFHVSPLCRRSPGLLYRQLRPLRLGFPFQGFPDTSLILNRDRWNEINHREFNAVKKPLHIYVDLRRSRPLEIDRGPVGPSTPGNPQWAQQMQCSRPLLSPSSRWQSLWKIFLAQAGQ
jgi:hypothetical protein